jgi:hypothetical protein
MQIQSLGDLQVGDKGYEGDDQNAWVIVEFREAVRRSIIVRQEGTGETDRLSPEMAAAEDFAWFRDETAASIAQQVQKMIGTARGEFFPNGSIEISANKMTAQFNIETSEGQAWTVHITPKA